MITETEIDRRSAEMYARIAGILGEKPAVTEVAQSELDNLPDFGARFESRIGSWHRPHVFVYEGQEMVRDTGHGLAIEIEGHDDLRGRAAVVERLDSRGEEYFLMVLSPAITTAVSTMEENSDRDLLRRKYDVLPSRHDGDPTKGIHFQGRLGYVSGESSRMSFLYEPKFIPQGIDAAEYQRQQQLLAVKYLAEPQKNLGGITLLEGLVHHTTSRLKLRWN